MSSVKLFPEGLKIAGGRFRPSNQTTVCAWKGTARYYEVVVNGKTNRDAAWYYPDPEPAASVIKGHMALWKGVKIQE